ncbi:MULTISPECIES: DUF6056 family protein [unclassified Streptomyces]|uniref:DUF6056 family protein n=1 Tax=unclassified Streptomyces TaxID=2593676 RepID=UPI000DC78C76|nr:MULTISPECIES: DUF6056 family protein [unclassified Streptomyces]AWZ06007.1 hypothetical protein DRB89_16785 [Streptomyces sp. ICC4]AWZ13559.1 hypothetical protein DRB96_16020 [Streptomyces sp. ICC1]
MSTASGAGESDEVRPPSSTADRAAGRRPLLRGLLPATGAVLVAAAGALVAVGCFLGLYVRPTSDDWCAAWKSRDMGVFGITSDFYMTQNGRLANAFLSGVVYGDGLAGTKILPTVIAVTFTVGLVLLGRDFVRSLGGRPRLLVLIACALVVQVLVYFAGTRSYQVLLWAPATISHTIPSVIGVWSLLLAFRTAGHPRTAVRVAGFVSAFLIGFVLGTLSEPFSLVSGLLAGMVGLLCLPRLGLARNWHPFTWCLAWCSGLVCGLVVLYSSPGARWRRAQQPAKESLLSAHELKGTVRDWLHMWDSVTGQWAYLGAVAVGVLLGLASGRLGAAPGRLEPRRAVPRKVLAALLLLPVPVVVLGSLAVVVGLRSGYGATGWTYARTWTSYLVPMELALCGYGALLGAWGGRWLSGLRRAGAALAACAVAAGCLALASVAVLVPDVQRLTTAAVTRSVAWDAQDARIRAEAARGAKDAAYEPLYIGSLAEPFFTGNYERDWVAACVSKWYGIDRIHRG